MFHLYEAVRFKLIYPQKTKNLFKLFLKVWHCSACGQQGRGNEVSHIASVHMGSASPYRCQCGQSFVWSNDLYRHVRDQHIGRSYTCNACGDVFATETSAVQHVQIHQRNGDTY